MDNSFSISALDEVPVVCMMGPTATGKTDAAAAFTDAVDAEIISVDSSLVYQWMNIGSAKPDDEFLRKYPHHLVDIRHPNDTYSVADFYDDCTTLVADILARGRVPVLAGGTMFYYNALEKGLTELPAASPRFRAEFDEELATKGQKYLHAKLSKLDPVSADRINPSDTQRLQRALEIVSLSGKTVEEHEESRKPPLANPMIKIALAFTDRSLLHDRIEQRFDIMLNAGLEEEVKNLLDLGVDPETTSMRMIGYRQMLEYLSGDITYVEMRNKGIAATRQLAKRQLTWLRNQSNVVWWMNGAQETPKFQSLIKFLEQKF